VLLPIEVGVTVHPSILVFVVEDEPLIQDLIEHALEEGGFSVEKASTAEHAIQLLDEKGADYRALVTDIKLGHSKLLGWDVAKHAREINHNVPVVYMTGDSGHAWASNGVPGSSYREAVRAGASRHGGSSTHQCTDPQLVRSRRCGDLTK